MNSKKFKIHYFTRLTIFWLLLFALFRLLFIIYHHAKFPDGQHSETSLSFLYAIRLDISTICWLSIIPFIIWSFQQFYKTKFLHLLNKGYIIIIISIVSILSIANIKIYGDWGTQLSVRALRYLLYPREIIAFISIWSLSILIFTCTICIYLAIKFYSKYLSNFSYPIEKKTIRIVQIVALGGLLIIGIRGGLQNIPINESSSYYSKNRINNAIATNNIWYLFHSIRDANATQNLYAYLDPAVAKKNRDDLFPEPSSNKQNILKNKQPNIIIIILESWTADIIKSLGGEPGITPHFEELEKDGLLFSQMYSSGFRTEQGLISILGGFPAQPSNSIITTPSKAEQLPSLNLELQQKGYKSSFYYGGDLEFANMKSYLLNTQFQKIIDKYNFEKTQLNSRWGAHDEHVFTKQLNDLKNETQPFFSTILTLSTHEPFEVPMQTPFSGSAESEKFKKAAYYTDYCLFNYFKEAKKQPWYNNTLFVLVADHGHHLPKEKRELSLPECYKLTALLTGGVLLDSMRGKRYNRICSQHDLPATILSQLNMPTEKFKWSRNVFDQKHKEFAYYTCDSGFGWITPEQMTTYIFNPEQIELSKPNTRKTLNDSLLIQAKSYLQTLYQQYLDY